MKKVTKYPVGHNNCAVYLFSCMEMRVCKIGVAYNPTSRLKTVQTHNWCRIEVDEEYWVQGRSDAFKVEKLVHKELKPFHIRGEWFGLPPYKAATAIRAVLRDCGYDYDGYAEEAEYELMEALDI